ncbi:hypothetical protein CEXT_440311 [Caerostris extrusa]|uniref:Uncharacterized protein n=1 Tax=Caerostris extrusa TaxID=172846 RepID=A0AAV4UJL1_CAEEX|nr:hypothetical protein CEXT_440311 [Caerostris extrusa]
MRPSMSLEIQSSVPSVSRYTCKEFTSNKHLGNSKIQIKIDYACSQEILSTTSGWRPLHLPEVETMNGLFQANSHVSVLHSLVQYVIPANKERRRPLNKVVYNSISRKYTKL